MALNNVRNELLILFSSRFGEIDNKIAVILIHFILNIDD
jgi:hypothetical protein